MRCIAAGIWGTSSRAPEDGDSDWTSCVRPAGIVPPDPSDEDQESPPAPMRLRSHRVSRPPRDRPCGLTRRSRAWHAVPHSVLCLIMRRPRVKRRVRRSWSRTSLDQCPFYRTVSREIFLRNMEIVGGDPGPFRFDPTARQTPFIRHRAAPDPARGRGRATGAIATTDHRRDRRRRGSPEPSTGFGGEVVMTRADHATGTDRVAEVAAATAKRRGSSSTCKETSPRSPATRWITSSRFSKNDPEAPMATLATPIRDEAIYRDPVLRQGRVLADGAGHSTSREARSPAIETDYPIRHRPPPPVAHLHLGLYAYRREFLLGLGSLPPSPWRPPRSWSSSACSKPGYPIAVGIVDEPSVGIDTPGGLPSLRRTLAGRTRFEGRRPGSLSRGDVTRLAIETPLEIRGIAMSNGMIRAGTPVSFAHDGRRAEQSEPRCPKALRISLSLKPQGTAPRDHATDRRDLRGMRRDPPPGPLAAAQLSRGRRDPGRPARDPLSRATAGGRTCTWATSPTTSAT